MLYLNFNGRVGAWDRREAIGVVKTVRDCEPGKLRELGRGAIRSFNYRVNGLGAVLEQLRAEGGTIDPNREDAKSGRFAWITDPEGDRIELWELSRSE